MNSLIDSITSPLKAAGDTAKGLVNIRDTAKFGDAVIELQTQILAAQQGAFAAQRRETALAQEVSDLKKRIAEFETWETEKEKYELLKLPPGVLVRSLKKDEESAEVLHYICADCYERGQKSYLHSGGQSQGTEHFTCHTCNSEIIAGEWRAQPINYDHEPLA